MKIIGITGAIGCGKTTISSLFGQMGYDIFDADKEVAEIYKDDAFLFQLKTVFPKIFKNGNIDKKLLRKVVFSDQQELIKLENIVEPFLEKRFTNKIEEVSQKEGLFFIDAVLLFEKGWNKYCQKVICVTVDDDIQKQRVMQRDGISEDEFWDIYHLQMSKDKKCALADIVIDTNCSFEKLKLKVKEIVRIL